MALVICVILVCDWRSILPHSGKHWSSTRQIIPPVEVHRSAMSEIASLDSFSVVEATPPTQDDPISQLENQMGHVARAQVVCFEVACDPWCLKVAIRHGTYQTDLVCLGGILCRPAADDEEVKEEPSQRQNLPRVGAGFEGAGWPGMQPHGRNPSCHIFQHFFTLCAATSWSILSLRWSIRKKRSNWRWPKLCRCENMSWR